MVETMLPVDFPHNPPDNFSYEVENFKRNFLAIWLVHLTRNISTLKVRKCVQSGDFTIQNLNRAMHLSTVEKVGDVVNNSTPYTAMQLNLNPLEAAFL